MFNSYRDSTSSTGSASYGQQPQHQQHQQHQQPQQPDSYSQNMSAIHTSLRNLTNYAQLQMQQTGTEPLGTVVKDGFKALGDSLNALTKQIEINNRMTLFTLGQLCNGTGSGAGAGAGTGNGYDAQQDHDKRAGDDFRKLLSHLSGIDGTLLKDVAAQMGMPAGQPAGHSGALNRTTSNSRLYGSVGGQEAVNMPSHGQQHAQQHQQHQQHQQQHQAEAQAQAAALARSRRDLPQRVSSTSISASLKSNNTVANAAHAAQDRQAYSDRRFQQQLPLTQKNAAQQQAGALGDSSGLSEPSRTRTSSQLSSIDASAVDSASKKARKTYKDHEPIYVLTQPSKVSIKEAWIEYTVGLSGSPAVRDLEHRYRTRWRGGSNHTISKQYTNRIPFYKFLEALETQNRVDFGIKFLEDYCAKNGNKNFRWLQFNMPSEAEFGRYSFEHRSAM